jgi:hypothetical protein
MRKFVTIAAALGFLGATGLAPALAAPQTDVSAAKTVKHHKKAKKAHKAKAHKKAVHKKAAPKKAKSSAIFYRIAA